MKSLMTAVTAALLLFYQGAVFGQQPLSCRDPSNTLLWKINGKHSTVYLFGSIHVGRADFYPLPAVIESAFHNAQHIVFEVDPNSLTDPAVFADIEAQGVLQDGKTLSDVLSKPVMDNLVTTLNGMGMPANIFMRFKPWFITMVLSDLQMASLGYLPDQGIELHLIKEKSSQSEILELESIQQQISFLTNLNGETFLAYTLLDFDEAKDKIPQMINAWRCADHEALEDLLFNDLETASAEDPEMKKLVDMLFYERNKKMSKTIRGYLENGEGDYFVTVGAGHLIGDRSIVDILDDRYKVENIKKSY